ncbi:MAG: ubiquinone/menaquinone biosynthesis methyltransferase [Anaerolineae bacterium]|nr:ubiquinone/menaquinone biosynthesis methyltransferase [Anaerolineae bacterium]
MSTLHGAERTRYVRRLFAQIAPRYDLLNRLMTGGQDLRWRREAVRQLNLPEDGLALDVGAGTGDVALAMRNMYPKARIVACDITVEMIARARRRAHSESVHWVIADAQHLPFASQHFDGVISAYLLRNVGDLDETLLEQRRVLKRGGRMVSLDTTPPPSGFLQPFIHFYLRRIIPLMGRLFAGNSEAYTYLPDSTTRFLSAEKLAERMQDCGFANVRFMRRMFGTMAIHCSSRS